MRERKILLLEAAVHWKFLVVVASTIGTRKENKNISGKDSEKGEKILFICVTTMTFLCAIRWSLRKWLNKKKTLALGGEAAVMLSGREENSSISFRQPQIYDVLPLIDFSFASTSDKFWAQWVVSQAEKALIGPSDIGDGVLVTKIFPTQWSPENLFLSGEKSCVHCSHVTRVILCTYTQQKAHTHAQPEFFSYFRLFLNLVPLFAS